MTTYGLIGKSLSHSFSPQYFADKFAQLDIDAQYLKFELDDLAVFPYLLKQNNQLAGLNVTIPYKQAIIPFLDELDDAAKHIGAVNCITIKNGITTGYNTDWIGFQKSLWPLLKTNTEYQALIFGNGGAAQAIQYALRRLNIPFQSVVRNPHDGSSITYDHLTAEICAQHLLWINTTPVGTYPNIEELLPLPMQQIGAHHILYDLIYNPDTTSFMKMGIAQNATVKNGLEMLHLQAEEGWKLWNKTAQ